MDDGGHIELVFSGTRTTRIRQYHFACDYTASSSRDPKF